MQQFNVPSDHVATGLALGVSAGVASGICQLTKEGKALQKPTYVPVTLPTYGDDRKMLSFDYNIKGEDIDEILGSRFKNTVFVTEVARQETMKAIFQRVLDDPRTPPRTKYLILDQFDQLDVPRMHAQLTHTSALKATKVMNKANEDLEFSPETINPPELGNNFLTTTTVKNLFAISGLGPEDKFSISDPNSKPLKHYLLPLADIITTEGLSERGAYLLLCHVVKGVVLEQVKYAMTDEKIPFKEFWIILQKIGNKTTSADSFMKELEKVLYNKPEQIEDALMKIKNLRVKIHMNEKNESFRKQLIETNTIRDFFTLLERHFIGKAPFILMTYKQKINENEMEQLTNGLFDVSSQKPNKVYILMEIICSVLSDNGYMGSYVPSFPAKTEKAKISAVDTVKGNNKKEQPFNRKQKRAQVEALGDALLDQGRNVRNNYPSNNYPPRQDRPQWQSNQNVQNPTERTLCRLCGFNNHVKEDCAIYPNDPGTGQQCSTCPGFHSGPCTKPFRPNDPRLGGPRIRNNRPPYRAPSSRRHQRDDPALTQRDVAVLMKKIDDINRSLSNKQGDGLGNGGLQGLPTNAMLSACRGDHP